MDSNSTRRARRVLASEVQKRRSASFDAPPSLLLDLLSLRHRSFGPNNRALAPSSLFASDDDSRGTHATCLTAKVR